MDTLTIQPVYKVASRASPPKNPGNNLAVRLQIDALRILLRENSLYKILKDKRVRIIYRVDNADSVTRLFEEIKSVEFVDGELTIDGTSADHKSGHITVVNLVYFQFHIISLN